MIGTSFFLNIKHQPSIRSIMRNGMMVIKWNKYIENAINKITEIEY